MRYGIYIHNPEGDMGEGMIVGAYKTGERADERAAQIRRYAERQGYDYTLECIVVPLVGDSQSAASIVERVASS